MTGILVPPKDQWIDINGNPLAGGFIYTYIVNTLDEKTTWADINKVTTNSNPVVLDASGRHAIFGDGDYTFVIKDSLGNLVDEGETNEFLLADFISTVMRPVTQAETLQQARDLMGVTAAIQAAVDNIELLAGPTGPTGATGSQGAVGPTGSATAGYQPLLNGNNPGYLTLPNINGTASSFYFQFGQSTTSATGSVTVNFAQSFPTGLFGVYTQIVTSTADTSTQVFSQNVSGFVCATSGITLPGGGFRGPITFNWMAVGY